MELIFLLKAAAMGVVEGLTEFLPISSTGHLILAGSLLRFTVSPSFDIAIQTGAILAVLWEYQARFIGTLRGIGHQKNAQRFASNLLIAFIPAVIFGLLLGAWIQSHLFHPVPVAMAFILGGLAILWIEKRQDRRYGLSATQTEEQGRATDIATDSVATQTSTTPKMIDSVDSIRPIQALQLGLIQCLALIPGTSRSGATIMGGLLLGFSRKTAAEFSFFLGVPTLLGASVYSLYKDRENLHGNDLGLLLVATLFAGLSAWICIRWLIHYVSHHDFRIFAWYRIAFGCFILLSAYAGWIDWSH